MSDAIDERRRMLAVAMLASGMLTTAAVMGVAAPNAQAGIFGRRPKPLKAGRSVFEVRGSVRVNGKPVDRKTVISASDEVETGEDGQLIFATGKDAFLLRRNTRMKMRPAAADRGVVDEISVRRGGVLSVFGKRNHRIRTPYANLGIRGTGLYVEVEEGKDYTFTCYGEVRIAASDDASSVEDVVSKQHDAPRYVTGSGARGKRITDAPFKNHTDEELMIIEAIVGREPPFAVAGSGYSAPRRIRY